MNTSLQWTYVQCRSFLFLELINEIYETFTNYFFFNNLLQGQSQFDVLENPSTVNAIKSRKIKQIYSHFLIFNIIWLGSKTSYEQIEIFSTKCLLTVYEKIFPYEIFIFGKLCHNLQRLNFGAVISIISI